MSTPRNLFNSALARTGFTVIYAIIAFFLMPFLVSHLGERWYGIWILVSALAANSYLLDIGMTMAATRFITRSLAAGDKDGANRVISSCLVIYTVLAAVIMALIVLVSVFAHRFVDDPRDVNIIRATILLIGFQHAAEFPYKAFAGIISSFVRYDLLMLSRLANVVTSSALMVYFVSHGYGVLTMAIIVVLVDQPLNYAYYRIAKHLFPELKVRREFVSKALVKEMFGYSSWSFVIQIANQLRFRTDNFVIGAILGASPITFYAVGLRLVEYLVDFVNRATNMLAPVFTRYFHDNNYVEMRNKYLFVTRINAVLGIFGGGMLVILGGAFITRWMGPEFTRSYPVLVVLTAGMIVELIGIHADNVLYAVNRHKYLAIINMVEAGLNLALSITFAHFWGIVGVAIGTAAPLIFFRLFVIPQLVGRFLGLSVWTYYRSLLPLTAYTLVYLAVCGYVARPFLAVPSYGAIVLVGIACVPLYALTIPFVGFRADERAQVQQALPMRVRRFTAPLLGR